MPKTRFTYHGYCRVGLRAPVNDEQVAALLDSNRCVNILVDHTKRRVHRLCYSVEWKDYYVVIQDVFTGDVVTILRTKHEASRVRISKGMKRRAAGLADGRIDPIFEGVPWGHVDTEVPPELELMSITAVFARSKKRGERVDLLLNCSVADYGDNIYEALTRIDVREALRDALEKAQKNGGRFMGFAVRYEKEGFSYPLGGKDLLDHLPEESLALDEELDGLRPLGDCNHEVFVLLKRSGGNAIRKIFTISDQQTGHEVLAYLRTDESRELLLNGAEKIMDLDDELLGYAVKNSRTGWLQTLAWEKLFDSDPPQSARSQKKLTTGDWYARYAKSYNRTCVKSGPSLVFMALVEDADMQRSHRKMVTVSMDRYGRNINWLMSATNDFLSWIKNFVTNSLDPQEEMLETVAYAETSEGKMLGAINLRDFLVHAFVMEEDDLSDLTYERLREVLFCRKDPQEGWVATREPGDGLSVPASRLVNKEPPFERFHCSVQVLDGDKRKEVDLASFDARKYSFTWNLLMSDQEVRNKLNMLWQRVSEQQGYEYVSFWIRQGKKAAPLKVDPPSAFV